MKAFQPVNGRPWYDNRFEQETIEWMTRMKIEQDVSPVVLHLVCLYALARYMAWRDKEVKSF
jgi:hypothetical protein